jgi:large subunit ribosomal protein L24
MARATAAKPKKMSRSKAEGVPRRILLKKDDMVKVIAGKDKGKSGRVLEVIRDKGRVLVEHVGMVKRHTRPNPAKQIKGGIAEREGSIHVSNVMLMTAGGVATRVGIKVEGNRRTRIARKTGEPVDKK